MGLYRPTQIKPYLMDVLVSFSSFICIVFSSVAQAEYQDRLELGAGIVASSSQSSFELGTEYERRLDEVFGLGATGNVIFASPSLILIAVPNVFVHPTGGDWLLSGAPLVEFSSSGATNIGLRFGIRIPIPLGRAVLIPEAAVDFIAGGPITIIGLGIGF